MAASGRQLSSDHGTPTTAPSEWLAVSTAVSQYSVKLGFSQF